MMMRNTEGLDDGEKRRTTGNQFLARQTRGVTYERKVEEKKGVGLAAIPC